MAKSKSSERQIAESVAADLARREKRTAKALVKTEQQSLLRARRAMKHANQIVAATPTAASVRRYTPTIHATMAGELFRTRRDAREAGRSRLEEETDKEFSRIGDNSLEDDEAASFVAAAGITAAWGNAALAAIAAGTNLEKVVDTIDSNIERSVVTEGADAFNDERSRLLLQFGELDLETYAEEPKRVPPPGMFKVYSAILDGKTCARCFDADGEVVELHASFKYADPPLHPRCRCIIEHAIIPRPELLEDIAIDYELFKQELADVIRENRIISGRQALSFASDSQGSTRSPKALTKRYAKEPYASR